MPSPRKLAAMEKAIKPFEFFKPGTHTAVNGVAYTFDAAAVNELVSSYNPDFSDAPLVVGHPTLTAPRFGKAQRLFVSDKGVAMCEAGDLVAEFAEMVNNKMYPRVSASIYMPTAKGNPTPGKHYLRHIGFLGGVAPAVKGLEMVEFAADADADGIVSFGDWDDRLTAGMFRSIRNWILSKFGQEDADRALSEWAVQDLADSAAQPEANNANANAISNFSTPPTHPTTSQEIPMDATQLAELAAFKNREAALLAREAAVNAASALAARTEVANFAEGLITAGKLIPAHKDAVVEVLCQLDQAGDGKGQIASFAAAPEHADHGKTGGVLLRELLSNLPKQVTFDKLPDGAGVGTADFAAPDGATVDASGLELMARAEAHQKANPGMSLTDAAIALQKQA